MHGGAKRNWRLTQLVGAMKRNEYPNARSMVSRLTRTGDPRARTSSRTLQRDIDHLRLRLDAPIAGIRQGNVFDYEAVGDVVVECDADKARVIGEREWFPGQKTEPLADGGLRLTFPKAPRPELVYGAMSYCGHLAVRSPQGLVAELREAGERIVAGHGGKPGKE